MIDTKKMRRLAQEATSGEWYFVRGNYIYGRKKVTDGEEEWHPLIACTDDDEVNVNFEVNAAFIAAANPAAISELIDRIEQLESDLATAEQDSRQKQARIERLEQALQAMTKTYKSVPYAQWPAEMHFADEVLGESK